jgi:Protein of unknown function (DUF4231)
MSDRTCCMGRMDDREEWQMVLQQLDLSPAQKKMIETRFIHMIETFHKRARNYSRMFYMGHVIITVGSLFVPALLSIQNSNANITAGNTNFSVQVYWATFIISLLVTIFNGILTLFKIDKKYYFLNTALERLRTEGWQYMELTGRYAGHLVGHGIVPTHKNQFVFFTHQIEKIKMKQVEEEYYKSDEKITQAPHGAQPTTAAVDLYPPSPDQPLQSMGEAPLSIKDTLSSMILSQKQVLEKTPTLDKKNPVFKEEPPTNVVPTNVVIK